MRSSSAARIALLLAFAGCAHAASPPPAPAPGASTAAAPSGGGEAAGGARTANPRLDARLDPGEEITAEELASIPEPIPGAPEDAVPSTAVPPAASGAPEAAPPGAAAWRVQIFASPDLAAADSVAKSASAVLEASYTIEYEGTLYKVRLGAFGSEQEAQALRDRAVKSGFPGAFRVRSVTR